MIAGKSGSRIKWFMGISTLVCVLDQITKWLAVEHLTKAFEKTGRHEAATTFGEQLDRFLWLEHPVRSEAISVIDSFWHFRYVENPGAAFGLFSGQSASFRTPFFVIVSIVAFAFILNLYRQSKPNQVCLRVSLAMIFGGAIGNFLDRIRLGYVIDFIDWHWYDVATWPTFNIADAAISVGVCLLLIDMWRHGEPDKADEITS